MKEKSTAIITKKKMTRYHSAPFPSCFRLPSTTTTATTATAPAIDYPHSPPFPPPTTTATTTPNLTTFLYQTHLGLFSLTWSTALLSRSLHLQLHHSLSSPSFHLTLKPFLFWNKQGIKKLTHEPESKSIWVFWDFTNARFGSRPEPESGFYIAALYDGEMTLLVGDLEKEAYLKTRAKRPDTRKEAQSLVIRREHVFGKSKFYTTRTDLGGKSRLISIELNPNCSEDDPRLVIRFDQKRVLQVKHLKWKFRGSERIEVDGYPIQLSWDVYNWLFEEDSNQDDDGYALFTFSFEKQGNEIEFDCHNKDLERETRGERMVTWSQDSCGLNYERKKMKKRLLMKTRSSSSSSISSASSGCSSVLEWQSVEENELKGPTGFSLLVYAWKS